MLNQHWNSTEAYIFSCDFKFRDYFKSRVFISVDVALPEQFFVPSSRRGKKNYERASST